MKVVLDTNVFISGVFWKGPPHRILNLWAKNKFQIVISKKILDEYLHILNKIDFSGKTLNKWAPFILEDSIILEDKNLVSICRDPEDNKFLNIALVAGAEYLISGDDDLLCLNFIKRTKIIKPVEFLKIVKSTFR